MRKHLSLVILIALSLLALALRLSHLDTNTYRDDEIVTTLAARPPIAKIYTSLSDYSVHHMPLYYTLVHIWMNLGDDLVTLRLLSVIIGTACVPMIYLLAQELSRPRVALVAAALISVSPAQIFHSQQARMYPLVTFVVIWASLMFVQAWRRGRWYRWFWYGTAFAVGWYTHVYVPFSLLALNVWAVCDSWRQGKIPWGRWGGLVVAQTVGLILFLPFAPQFLHGVEHASEHFWLASSTPLDWLPAILEYSNGATFRLASYHERMTIGALTATDAVNIAIVIVGTGVPIGVFIATIRHTSHPTSELLLYILVWVPLLVAIIISLTIKPILFNRYLIGISPPLLILIAWAADRFWHLRTVWVVAILFATSTAMNLETIYSPTLQQNTSIGLVDMIAHEQQPGDAIAASHWLMFDTIVFTHPEFDDIYVMPGTAYDATYWQRRMSYLDWHAQVLPVADYAPHYRRVWLILVIQDPDFPYLQRVNQGWLNAHGHLLKKDERNGTFVFLYKVTPP